MYCDLIAKFERATAAVKLAVRARDLYRLAVARLERAWVEMELRDLYGPWNGRQYNHWAAWMAEDIDQANAAAAELERAVGDSQLAGRLLIDYPRLRALAALAS